MKAAFLAVFFLVAHFAAQAADTAYSALRVVGKRDGAEVLNHVLEVRGRGGAPQPAIWKITLDDPKARGGIREYEVQGGKIIGERTPAGGKVGTPMNFAQLNLDSEGVFTIANQEAQKAVIPFDHVDYLLKSGPGGTPVWELTLFEGKTDRVGELEVSADSGAVLRTELNRAKQPVYQNNDRDYVGTTGTPGTTDPRPSQPLPPPPRTATGGYSQAGQSFRGVGDFFHRLGKRFERRGEQMENFFTGKPVEPLNPDEDR